MPGQWMPYKPYSFELGLNRPRRNGWTWEAGGANFEVGKRDSEVSQMEKVALRKTVWIAFLLLQMCRAFLSLGYCIFVESGPTSELGTVGKDAHSSCSSV